MAQVPTNVLSQNNRISEGFSIYNCFFTGFTEQKYVFSSVIGYKRYNFGAF